MIIKLPVIFLLLSTTFSGCIEPKDCNLLPEATGKLTITNIPEEHNGKFIWAYGWLSSLSTSGSYSLMGLLNATVSSKKIIYKLVQIHDNNVIIPIYKLEENNKKITFHSHDLNETRNYSMFVCIIDGTDGYYTKFEVFSILEGFFYYFAESMIEIDDFIYIPIATGDFINGNLTISWIKTGIEENE